MLFTLCLFIGLFGSLVIVHELGHFLVAKLFKIKINEFSVGFGSLIAKRQDKSGVQWSVRSMPFGGYVAFDDEGTHTLEKAPLFQKICVCFAGPCANLVLAFVISFFVVLFNGYQAPSGNIIGATHIAQMKKGDKIISINNNTIQNWRDVEINLLGKKKANVTILRDNNQHQVTIESLKGKIIKHNIFKKILNYIKPQSTEHECEWGFDPVLAKKQTLNITQSLKTAGVIVAAYVKEFFIMLKIIANQGLQMLSGPVGIAKTLGKAYSRNLEALLWLTVRLSVSLAMFNLLPLPGLDGGQILLALIRKLTRNKLGERFIKIWHYSAFILLIGLTFYTTILDLFKS